jgi:hypothetical protein
MENIGQVTVDLSGSLALTKDLCERLGLVPGEKLAVSRGYNGEVSLKPLENGGVDETTQRLNTVYEKQDSSLAPMLVQMQNTALEAEDW